MITMPVMIHTNTDTAQTFILKQIPILILVSVSIWNQHRYQIFYFIIYMISLSYQYRYYRYRYQARIHTDTNIRISKFQSYLYRFSDTKIHTDKILILVWYDTVIAVSIEGYLAAPRALAHLMLRPD